MQCEKNIILKNRLVPTSSSLGKCAGRAFISQVAGAGSELLIRHKFEFQEFPRLQKRHISLVYRRDFSLQIRDRALANVSLKRRRFLEVQED
jgi:hypothetical protein